MCSRCKTTAGLDEEVWIARLCKIRQSSGTILLNAAPRAAYDGSEMASTRDSSDEPALDRPRPVASRVVAGRVFVNGV